MSGSKIQFSKDELDLVKNSSWILTKNLIIDKIVEGMGELSVRMTEMVATMDLYFDEVIKNAGPRISRGERYQGLPWLVLDYPRTFGKQDIFAIRCFFWWGRHFSISIHCRGKYLPELTRGILANTDPLREGNYFLSTTGDEWVHDLEANPHQSIKFFRKDQLAEKLDKPQFIRLGCLIPLDQWNVMEEKLFKEFEVLIETMKID